MPPKPFRFFQLPWRTRATIARDVDAELEFHLEARVSELAAQGLPPDRARQRAHEEFGDVEFTRRYCRDLDQRSERKLRFADRLTAWIQDVRYAWRTLRRSPGFAAVTIVTLALAIGANTAIFSVARAVLLKPLPFGDPGALVGVYSTPTQQPDSRWDLSAPDLADYRVRQHSLTGIAAYYRRLGTWLPPGADPEIVTAMSASTNLFDLLEVRAWRGRTFVAGDDLPGASPKVILSYRLWHRAFGSDTGIVGRTIMFADRPHTVIGIMPRGFGVVGPEELWVPVDLTEDLANPVVTRKQRVYSALARLKPGVSLDGGRNDIGAIARQLQAEYPAADAAFLATVEPLHERMTGRLQRPVLLLLTAAIAVLLIACANLANLTLARSFGRRADIAVRAALGAGRGRLARQLLTESILLALIGGGLGIALAVGATRTLLALNPELLSPMFEVGIDGRVLGVSLALSVATGVLFGLVPALEAGRTGLHGSIKDQGRSGTGSRGSERVRRALVVAQVGLAVVLLVGAGLLIRSFRDLTRAAIGFDPDHVLTAQLRVDGPRYDSATAVNRFYDGVLAEIAGSPGVVAAGAAMHVPMLGGGNSGLYVEGSAMDPDQVPSIGYTMIRGDYFKALRIPLVAGRTFDDTDTPDGPGTALLNQAAVRAFFPDGDAVGRRVRIGPNKQAPWTTIIGVVGDVRNEGFDTPAGPLYYDNGRQQTWWRTLSVVVRTAGNPIAAAPVIRQAVRNADPTRAVRDLEPLDQAIGSNLASRRFALGLAASFAGLALLLAAVGIYGVLAYSVTSRTREFGIRLALGAPKHSVLMLVLREGLGWSLAGLALGLAGAVAGGRLLTGMLYGVGPMDLGTYLAVGIGLLVVVTVACLVPAARATSTNPLTATRAE